MPRRLNPYVRQRIVFLKTDGKTVGEIVGILSEEGFPTTAQTVRRWIQRWETGEGLQDFRRSGRRPKITAEMGVFLNNRLKEDDELSSRELAYLLNKEYSIIISSSAIRAHLRQNLKWKVVRTRFGPMISETNKINRKAFALKCLQSKDEFNDVIWTDESSVQLRRHADYMRVQVGKERMLKPQAKHALKVNVWAGISKRGATKICIFDSIMDADLYIEILKDHLLPFLKDTFADGYKFMQDNDPKHTSKKAKQFYIDEKINWWKTPASSADLNPIERVWKELKHYLARQVKPLSKEELVQGIQQFWRLKMSITKCIKYISHTHSVLPLIVAKEGGITGE